MAAATDLHVFFDAVGDDAKLARHMAAMADSCDRFMDGGGAGGVDGRVPLPGRDG